MKVFCLAILASLLVLATGCDSQTSTVANAALVPKNIADGPDTLLETAFQAASLIPTDPHIKDRSKAQELVVVTCLEMDQPDRAARYTESVENWRRGMCLANLALYDARNGKPNTALELIAEATGVADTAEDWRRDRVRTRIAQTRTVLEKARRTETQKEDSPEAFDTKVQALDQEIAQGDFDTTRNALRAYAQMFKQFFSDETRRNLAEERIRSSWDPMPFVVRFELLLNLANSALDHDDKAKARSLLDEAQEMIEKRTWPMDHRISMLARVAAMRHTAGDPDRGRADADAALALFSNGKRTIVDIWRARALRPVAEAYQAMGDTPAAIAIYKQAIQEGRTNPNSRPRAEDLVATCCSMAQHGVKPDPELSKMIRETLEGLGSPW